MKPQLMLDLTIQSVQINVWENTVGGGFFCCCCECCCCVLLLMFEEKLYQFLSIKDIYLTCVYSHVNSGLVV